MRQTLYKPAIVLMQEPLLIANRIRGLTEGGDLCARRATKPESLRIIKKYGCGTNAEMLHQETGSGRKPKRKNEKRSEGVLGGLSSFRTPSEDFKEQYAIPNIGIWF